MKEISYEKQKENMQKHMRDRNADIYRRFFSGKGKDKGRGTSKKEEGGSHAITRREREEEGKTCKVLQFRPRTARETPNGENTQESDASNKPTGSSTEL